MRVEPIDTGYYNTSKNMDLKVPVKRGHIAGSDSNDAVQAHIGKYSVDTSGAGASAEGSVTSVGVNTKHVDANLNTYNGKAGLQATRSGGKISAKAGAEASFLSGDVSVEFDIGSKHIKIGGEASLGSVGAYGEASYGKKTGIKTRGKVGTGLVGVGGSVEISDKKKESMIMDSLPDGTGDLRYRG